MWKIAEQHFYGPLNYADYCAIQLYLKSLKVQYRELCCETV